MLRTAHVRPHVRTHALEDFMNEAQSPMGFGSRSMRPAPPFLRVVREP
jgi:hypothetical protein